MFLAYVLFLLPAAKASVSEWTNFELVAGLITFEVSFDGVSAIAILDTGAHRHGISRAFLDENGIEYRDGQQVILSGAFGRVNEQMIEGVRMTIFGTTVDLGSVMPIANDAIDVVIGLPFFHAAVFQIDYPNTRMRIISHDAFDFTGKPNLRTRKEDDAMLVRVTLGSKPLWLTLDTGNNGGVLINRAIADSKGWLEHYQIRRSQATGMVRRDIGIDILQLPTAEFGPFELEDILVTVAEEGYSAQLRGGRSDGLLGYDLLKHFLLTVDFWRGKAHIDLP